VTNEPGFLLPVLYNYAGRPDKTPTSSPLNWRSAFTDQRAGIPGNDDSGAMSSWLIFNSLGFYPVAGQDIYLISTPSFPDASLSPGKWQKAPYHRQESRPCGAQSLHPVRDFERRRSTELLVPPRADQGRRNAGLYHGLQLHREWGRATPPPSMSDANYKTCPTIQPN
jgi:hypothetical protein